MDFLTIEKSAWKKREFFDQRNYVKKITWKQRVFFDQWNQIKKKYSETAWIFRPSYLRWKMYVETTWIFWSAKVHQKSTLKLRRNLSKFGLRRIDVISTWNRRRLNVVCLLGSPLFFYIFSLLSLVGTSVKCLFPLISWKYLLTL